MLNNPERFAALANMVLDDDRPQDPVLVIYGPMVPHAKIPERVYCNGPRLERPKDLPPSRWNHAQG